MLGLWLDAPKCRNVTVTHIIGQIAGPYSNNQESNKMFYIPVVAYWMCCTGFEWNKHRYTYVHWRIYSSRYLDTLLYKVEVIWNGNHSSLYKCNNRREWMRLLSEVQLTHWNWIELQLHEKVSHWDLNLWNVISLFASHLTAVSVNWYLHWLLITQSAGKTIRWWWCN